MIPQKKIMTKIHFFLHMSKKSCNFAPRMEVKVTIENGNIARIYTMQGELFCSLELPLEKGKITNEWMAHRLDHLFYEDYKSADKLDIIAFVIKECKKEGFIPRLYFDDEQSRQNIGALIRQVRLQRGLKARDVAMMVGIAAPNYCHIESGQTSPTYKTIMRIFDVLDIHMNIQPADLAPVNVEERAEEERNAAWEIEQKRLIAQVRKEHPKMLTWSAKRVKETKYFKQLVREYKGN
jgi:transcriptional regulator with XRE-family HTH domain